MAAETRRSKDHLPVKAVDSGTPRRRRWAASIREPGTALGLFLVVSLLLAGLLSPWLPLDDPTKINLSERLLPPSPGHLLGTDHLGRDTLSRVVHGARMTLLAAAATLALSMTIALTVGILSGYHGGWPDTALMAVVDLLRAFPSLILALAVAGALGPGLFNVLLAVDVLRLSHQLTGQRKCHPYEGSDIETARTGKNSGTQHRAGTPPFHRSGSGGNGSK